MIVRRLLAASILLVALAAPAATVILVRHAEKAGPTGDVPLTEAGRKRADRLADVLSSAGVTAIYTSEYRRTAETAAPIAKALGLMPKVLPAADLDTLIRELKTAASDDVILVVTHSDRLPLISAKLGADQTPVLETEFSRLVILRVEPMRTTQLTLRYGDK